MSSLDTSKDFIKHVFNMNEDSKSDMMNIVQYAIISVTPVVLLNKIMSKYVPEADEFKGSIELGGEVVAQIIVMFIGLLFIHRINTFIPTFSGDKYPEFNIVYIILAVLMITMSLQTKLGEKVSILSERAIQLWEGREGLSSQPAKAGNNVVTVSQPLANQHPQTQTHQVHVSGDNSTPISQLPVNQPSHTTQTTQNDNNMMSQMQMPVQEAFEPLASNDGGLGSFGAW